MKSYCKICGAKTLVTGWEWCETCASGQAKNTVGISLIADAICHFDITGVSRPDRLLHWKRFGISPQRVEAAEAHVADRYAAIERKRGPSSRGW